MRSDIGRRIGALSFARQFMLGSLIILLGGMAGVGLWVASQIETGVIHRTASTTALYVNSLIATPLQILAEQDTLRPEDAAELDRLLNETPLGQEVAVFHVWDADGRIVYSTAPDLIGHQLPVEGHLADAYDGDVTAEIGALEAERDDPSGVSQEELLEIYTPVRFRGTDEVIAAAEFYYGADDLRGAIASSQRRSWLVVGGATVMIYLVLSVFVQGASNTIDRQQRELTGQVTRLTDLLRLNGELHERVRGAAARTSALNEQFLRRFSSELHDGPAQDISLALLRLDNVAERTASNGHGPAAQAETARDLTLIETSLRHALQEVRTTSSGLLLPQIGPLSVGETVERAVRDHRRRSGTSVQIVPGALPERVPLPTKIALYRVIQEALTNAWRHAGGASTVAVGLVGGRLRVEIADHGPGFDVATIGGSEEHLGLVGMRERVESLGGDFAIRSAPGEGTRVMADLPLRLGGRDGD